MRTAICTISTRHHLFKTQALFRSLRPLVDADFFCLITDDPSGLPSDIEFNLLPMSDLQSEAATTIKRKYRGDNLRWALKSVTLLRLIEMGYDRVSYIDNDIFFFSSPQFIFDELEAQDIILTPHFYLSDPHRQQYWLEANFRIGLYNAGFICAGRQGAAALQWWADCCAYNVKRSAWRGLFDDQKYLDLFPILFNRVKILKHPGCNAAFWNIGQHKLNMNDRGQLMFDESFPLIFIHFTKGTLRSLRDGNFELLEPHFKAYLKTLLSFNPSFELKMLTGYSKDEVFSLVRHWAWMLATKLDSRG